MDDERYGGFFIDVEDQEEFWVVWIMENESKITHEMILDDCKSREEAILAGKDYIDAEAERHPKPHDKFGEWP